MCGESPGERKRATFKNCYSLKGLTEFSVRTFCLDVLFVFDKFERGGIMILVRTEGKARKESVRH